MKLDKAYERGSHSLFGFKGAILNFMHLFLFHLEQWTFIITGIEAVSVKNMGIIKN
jgi:hypothetical protein